jgi:hypothetical protein
VRYLPEEVTELYSRRLGPFRDYPGALRHTADPGTPRGLNIDSTAESAALEPPRFLRAVRVRFRVYTQPGQNTWVALEWKSSSASETNTAGIWTEGDGRQQEQLFWVWNDVASLSVSAIGGIQTYT